MKKIKLNKNVIALLLSILLALICAVLLKVIVDKKIESSLSTDTVSYIVANNDLPKGTIIDPFDSSQFAVRNDIPVEFAQSTAITPDQAENIEGALLLNDVKRGDVLTWMSIDTDESRQLSGRLSPGRRALTIPVDDESSISSMLKPNDHIDLILTYQKNGNIVAAPLMQNVRVLATGDSLSTSNSYLTDTNYNDSFRTITLDLDLDDVSKITTALELGRLSAVLRNPNDMTYTDNVVSLQTLQRELNLKTFDKPETFVPPSPPSIPDSYVEDINEKMFELKENTEETNVEVAPTPKPSIDVIYGNRHLKN
ncbi:Flp pilus assembly protein CpaB [Psychrobacter lutiphocae]|uniref:Flp pilus assembly protein CpaB n=1 Tax=Psychrobacter lutiphocae TaxID=540500 RepID=UPI0003715497|nr:Flp pilus assembly protein CpaB [Psychrobacter lutiphocae]